MSGKIDNLEKVILKLSDDFKTLEDRQVHVLQRHIETSSATVIAAFKKELEDIHQTLLIIADAIKACECNKEIIKIFNERLGKLPESIPSSSRPELPSPTGMTKDGRSPTGLKPATISSFVYTSRP